MESGRSPQRGSDSRRPLPARLLGAGARSARGIARTTGIEQSLEEAIEAAVVRAIESEGAQRALRRSLEGPALELAVERALASPAVERSIQRILESELVDRTWDRLLESEEAQKLVERIAEAPEVRSAITSQGAGLIEDIGDEVAEISRSLDDAFERIPRRLAGRGRRATPTRAAGLVSRGLALAIDVGLLNLAFLAGTALLGLSAAAVLPGGEKAGGTAIAVGAGAWVLFGGAYLLGFWSLAGRTPGMSFLGMHIEGPDGPRLGLARSVRRLLGLGVALAPLGAGLAAVLFDERRRGLHDRIAGTEVRFEGDPD